MQGHPNQWDEPRLEAFKTTVLYLKGKGCTFMTASEYLASHQKKP
jgi:translation elongation factor P/translation initiation factor 5A